MWLLLSRVFVKSLTGEVCSAVVTVCLCAPLHTLTQVRQDVGIHVTGQLSRALVLGVGDPAVRQPEALDHTGLSGKLPEDLHGAGI